MTLRYRVRRAANIPAFLVTGALFGMGVGFLIDYAGPDERCPAGATCQLAYEPSVSLAYFLVLGALAGIAVGGTLVVLVDKLLDRD